MEGGAGGGGDEGTQRGKGGFKVFYAPHSCLLDVLIEVTGKG